MLRLDWTQEQVDVTRSAAWATWLQYGAGMRRVIGEQCKATMGTELAVVAPKPRPQVVTPDEYIPPGMRHGFAGWRITNLWP